jgi:hypothetical protein
MLANKDSSSSNKKDSKRGNFLTLFYVSLFGFIFLSGSMLSISPSGLQTQTQPQAPVSLGLQDVDAQQYYPEPQRMGYDDRSYGGGYGGGDYYQSNSYDSNRYDSYGSNYDSYNDKSYDKKKDRKNVAEIERDDTKLHICRDTGIVVDDRINCPQICPFGTTLEGHYVTDLDTCNIQPGEGQSCPLDTDLPGVFVNNLAQCNIFAECDASSTPLGQSLGQDVKVADSALCQLSNVPNLQICEDGPFEGFAVNDLDACDTLDDVQICSLTSDLPGVLTTDPATCDIFETCDLNTPLGASIGQDVEVVDADICQLQFAVCDSDSGLARALGLTGEIIVADEQLCELEVTSGTTTCPAGSDLEGVVVLEEFANIICNLDIDGGNGITLETCPEGTLLEGVEVTSLELCNLVDEEFKECQICATLVNTIINQEFAFEAFQGFNDFPGGVSGICKSADIEAAYNGVIDQAITEEDVRPFLKDNFAACIAATENENGNG